MSWSASLQRQHLGLDILPVAGAQAGVRVFWQVLEFLKIPVVQHVEGSAPHGFLLRIAEQHLYLSPRRGE